MSTKVRASRPPAALDRESFSGVDRDEYDWLANLRPPDQYAFVSACLTSPQFAASLWRFIGPMVKFFGNSEFVSHKEQDLINVVLASDFGCTGMEMVVHIPFAVQNLGMRPEVPKALLEGHDDLLTDDERLFVDYIRAFVNGTVTDDMWSGMVERLGGVRGAVEYTFSVAIILLCGRMMQAFGTPSHSREELQEMVQDLRPGTEEDRRLAAEMLKKAYDY